MSDDQLCWRLRIEKESWQTALELFLAKGLLKRREGGYSIANWDKRQQGSESSSAAVAVEIQPSDSCSRFEQQFMGRSHLRNGCFQRAWKAYGDICVSAGTSPGNQHYAQQKWAEVFPGGEPPPLFWQSIEALGRVQLIGVKAGQREAYPPGFANYIQDPSGWQRAIDRLKALAENPAQLVRQRSSQSGLSIIQLAQMKLRQQGEEAV